LYIAHVKQVIHNTCAFD